jgi:TPR repeat protein
VLGRPAGLALGGGVAQHARRWYEQAAAAGDTGAMRNLGWLLAELDPPELDQARYWYEQAAAGTDEAEDSSAS